MVKRQFWTAFSLTLAVYLLGIAAAVWVIRPPEAPAAEPVREAVQYRPDPEEDLILLGVMEGEEPVVLLLGFFPAQERMAVLALTGENVPAGEPDALRRELEERYSLTIDAWLSGEPESWQQLVQGLGAATLTLDQDSTVTLDGGDSDPPGGTAAAGQPALHGAVPEREQSCRGNLPPPGAEYSASRRKDWGVRSFSPV